MAELYGKATGAVYASPDDPALHRDV